ncbi:hypothetical protein VE01_05232 [Pseudogymnoascus verrucosus]|uniref:Protein kinase domain-containing protein n=1 Tax=Pseudogymnoascus verrucosus TaxID=342668 RepID=A0A1B8GHY1_9PEZI|nr:uncharacterized protein VE01_05232 [Pseudogymnoascus verrucosus]OBT95418.1 hypothetical protein VE01_05232 [Pseudogymnoascus verrucosus]
MPGYGATIHEQEDGFKYFVLDNEEVGRRHGKYLPQCIIDSDFATFNFYTQKPELPYAIGSCLKAHPHTPQPPDNDITPGDEFDYGNERMEHESHTVDPLHRCLLHPPWPGKTEAGVVEFKVVDWVQAGDPNNSQVVAVRILNSTLDLPTDVDLLAKIYDPLYFDYLHYHTNIFQYLDFCYRRETAAYRQLTDLQGNIIPKYYGSFTMSLPGDGKISRHVRMILLEIVPGLSMDKLSPSGFKQAERQEMMKAIVDSERAVYAHKVINGDMHPRNILFPPDPLDRGCRAVIVDFGISRIIPNVQKEYPLPGVTRTAPPFHCVDTYNFFEWVDWDWDAWINEVYADIKGTSLTSREECVKHICREPKEEKG